MFIKVIYINFMKCINIDGFVRTNLSKQSQSHNNFTNEMFYGFVYIQFVVKYIECQLINKNRNIISLKNEL